MYLLPHFSIFFNYYNVLKNYLKIYKNMYNRAMFSPLPQASIWLSTALLDPIFI